MWREAASSGALAERLGLHKVFEAGYHKTMKSKLIILFLVLMAGLVGLTAFFLLRCEDDWCYVFRWQKVRAADSFERCAGFGFPVAESYPRQCRAGAKLFTESIDPTASWNEYNSEKFGLYFKYPAKYFLEEKELGDGHRGHFAIILTEDTEENRLVREGKSPGREGPVAITFDLYQSPEGPTALAWVMGHSGSNFKLSDGQYSEITIAGKPAISYSWDGLYQADNIVVAHNDYIASIAVTYIFPDEAIRKDFHEMLAYIQFR